MSLRPRLPWCGSGNLPARLCELVFNLYFHPPLTYTRAADSFGEEECEIVQSSYGGCPEWVSAAQSR